MLSIKLTNSIHVAYAGDVLEVTYNALRATELLKYQAFFADLQGAEDDPETSAKTTAFSIEVVAQLISGFEHVGRVAVVEEEAVREAAAELSEADEENYEELAERLLDLLKGIDDHDPDESSDEVLFSGKTWDELPLKDRKEVCNALYFAMTQPIFDRLIGGGDARFLG